jgi:hypothetical protein
MKNLAKRLVTIVGGVTIAAFLLTLAAPKAVHAIVSTLVTVANTDSNPVPTKATDNRARQAVVLTANLAAGDGQQLAFGPLLSPETGAAYTVPPGQRLVVESVTGNAEMTGGETPFTVQIAFDELMVQPGTQIPKIFLVPTLSGTAQGLSAFNFASDLTTYVEPGSILEVFFQRGPSSAGESILEITVSGHLESIASSSL